MDAGVVYNYGRHRIEGDMGYGAGRVPAPARQDRPYSSTPGIQQQNAYDVQRHGAPIPPLAPGAALSYDLDHLATFSAVSRHHGRLMTPDEGMKQFRQMVHKSGIWNLRVRLLVRTHELVVFDAETHDEMENFPIELVNRPAAFFSRKPDDIYRNIVLLTVLEDPLVEKSESEVHVFQSYEHSAQEIVDNIAAVKRGRLNSLAADYPSRKKEARPPAVNGGQRVNGLELAVQKTANVVNAYRQNVDRDPPGFQQRPQTAGQTSGGENLEQIEHWTEILNKCIDDIERFMGRLQSVAEAYQEMEKKKQNRKGGMVTMRTRSPSYTNFVDIFQKFRLAFNLLARLKHHIQSPNSVELVHALFSPLRLLYEASLNVAGENDESATSTNVPPMIRDAIALLAGCLSSNEKELWAMLGDTWIVSRNDHRTGERSNTYIPTFYDGWAPPATWLDNIDRGDDDDVMTSSRSSNVEKKHHHQHQPLAMAPQMMPTPPLNEKIYGGGGGFISPQKEKIYNGGFVPPPNQQIYGGGFVSPSNDQIYRDGGFVSPPEQYRQPAMSNDKSSFDRFVTKMFKSRSTASSVATESQDERSISSKTTAAPSASGKKVPNRPRFYEVIKNRQYVESDELTVRKGEVVEVLETKNSFWKVANSQGMVGFVPKSCFQPYFQIYQP